MGSRLGPNSRHHMVVGPNGEGEILASILEGGVFWAWKLRASPFLNLEEADRTSWKNTPWAALYLLEMFHRQ